MSAAERGINLSSIFGRKERPHSLNGESKEIEKVSPVKVEPLDLDNSELVQSYVSFLNDPKNRIHFSNPPEDIKKLKKWAKNPGSHFLIATREEIVEGKKQKVAVGGAEIVDAEPNQHDHFMVLFVVDPNKQSQGIGTEMLIKVKDWASQTLTHDGRVRNKLDAAVILDVPDFDHMAGLLKKLMFEFKMRLEDQVDVELEIDGRLQKVTKPVRRYETDLNTWRQIRNIVRPEEPQAQGK